MPEPEGRTFPFDGPETVTPGVLETFPYEYPQREAEVTIASEEWSCVCPFSGLPDYGALLVSYVPAELCIELKSLKYYITSYRTVGIYQEHAANRVLDDLVACCRPRRLEVVLDYNLRGGLHTIVICRWPAP
jgi:7-cyano-7-deazaguanine reductase